jgi:GGDEF domain-containing protein
LGGLDLYARSQVRTRPTILFYSPAGRAVPDFLLPWLDGKGLTVVPIADAGSVEQLVLRSLPSLVVIDADGAGAAGLELCARLKSDSYSAIVPLAAVATRHTTAAVKRWFAAGADEVITPLFEPAEQASRLDGLMARTARDVAVNPSTRLPGTTEIDREIRRRMDRGDLFAVCYADLDHFKEYNDRYSYYDGDRVIYILSRVLHDVVKGMVGSEGFVGHIGGDDFIVIVPFDAIARVCGEVLDVFDTLIPYQYNDQDRRAGYYFGKDRRGQLHRVPLMTLSIGIVTNQHRRFTHPAQVSELATEMKSYAKTQTGSVFVVDRRRDHDVEGEEGVGGGTDGGTGASA